MMENEEHEQWTAVYLCEVAGVLEGEEDQELGPSRLCRGWESLP